jgi:hypothetical protein
MVKIRSRLGQPLLIHRGKASPLYLLAYEAAVISEQELDTPHLQALIAAGAIESRRLKAATKEKKGAARHGARSGEASTSGAAPKRTEG